MDYLQRYENGLEKGPIFSSRYFTTHKPISAELFIVDWYITYWKLTFFGFGHSRDLLWLLNRRPKLRFCELWGKIEVKVYIHEYEHSTLAKNTKFT